MDLDTAVAESALRDAVPQSGRFEIAQSQLESKHVVRFAPNAAGDKLILANLTGAGLKRLGADNSISSVMQYAQTQKWAAAVHAHPAGVDGILFVSRQLNDKKAVVLFDRAKSKLGKASYAKLSDAKELESTKKRLGIKVVY